jgi:hypothetical protein
MRFSSNCPCCKRRPFEVSFFASAALDLLSFESMNKLENREPCKRNETAIAFLSHIIDEIKEIYGPYSLKLT